LGCSGIAYFDDFKSMACFSVGEFGDDGAEGSDLGEQLRLMSLEFADSAVCLVE